jgi:hypothetical protein
MKYITLIIGLLVVGCVTTPTMKSVSGTYEVKQRFGKMRYVFLESGIIETYTPHTRPLSKGPSGKWKISKNGELQVEYSKVGDFAIARLDSDGGIHFQGLIQIWRINSEGNLNLISVIPNEGKVELQKAKQMLKDGKRVDIPKDKQHTAIKIK